MFEGQTTIVLGAGASRQFGFPLGTHLYTDVINDIDKLEESFSRRNTTLRPLYTSPVSAHNAEEFHQDPLFTICAYLVRQPAGTFMPSSFEWSSPAQCMFAFRDDLKKQPHDSVDRFIRDNPRYGYIGKILLASKIIMNMYIYKNHVYTIRNFNQRTINQRRNWYHLLANFLHEPLRNSTILELPAVFIVTFNYDYSLECALRASLGQTDVHKSGLRSYQSPKIFHINGGPESIPNKITDVVATICNFAKDIHLVDEDVSERVSEVRQMARSAVANSERVFILGFAFDEANIRNIGLQEIDTARIYCHNFDGNLGVANNFRRLVPHKNHMISGSLDHPLYIDDVIAHGFFSF